MCVHTNRKVFTFSVTATTFSSAECKYIFEHMILFQRVQHTNLLYGFFTNHYYHFVDSVSTHVYNQLGPVPEWPISTNPGLKLCSVFVLNLSMYCLK